MNMPFTKVTYNNPYPSGPSTTQTQGNSNRETSEAVMKYGTIKKITYPTGGNTQFDYEANDFWDTIGYLELQPTSFHLSGEQCTYYETFAEEGNISFASTSELNSYRYN